MPLTHLDRLARLSRDRYFLVRTAIIIVAVSTLIAMVLSALTKPSDKLMSMVQDSIDAESTETRQKERLLQKIRSSFARRTIEEGTSLSLQETLQDLIKEGALDAIGSPEEVDLAIERADFLHETEKVLFLALNDGLQKDRTQSAISRVEATDKGHRYREEFLGDLYRKSERINEAVNAYIRESEEFPDAVYSKRSAVKLLRYERQFERLKLLLSDPEFTSAFNSAELMPLFADAREYGKLFVVTIKADFSHLASRFLFPALYSAAIWFLILLSFTRGQKRTILLTGLAFVFGIFSAGLTLYLVMLQERIQGFDYESQVTPLGRAIYFIAGVGLREELAKLICFIPLAILLRKQNNNLAALVIAGVVGLGFAAQENILYYQNTLGQVTYTPWTRLLTANAIHIAMTGVIGFYFYRMLVRKGRGWEDFLLNFILMVVAHGMYDAVLTLPSLSQYGPISVIIIALIVYRYLDPLKANIDTTRLHRRLSPLGIFVLGSVLLVCGTLVFSAVGAPFRFAFGAFAMAVGGMVPTAFVFISRFRDI